GDLYRARPEDVKPYWQRPRVDDNRGGFRDGTSIKDATFSRDFTIRKDDTRFDRDKTGDFKRDSTTKDRPFKDETRKADPPKDATKKVDGAAPKDGPPKDALKKDGGNN